MSLLQAAAANLPAAPLPDVAARQRAVPPTRRPTGGAGRGEGGGHCHAHPRLSHQSGAV